MEERAVFRVADGFTLKCLAVVCMTLDHAAIVFLPYGTAAYMALRIIGRQAFPIFCFLIAQGNIHTRSRGRYLARLFVFALIAEVPFDLALFGVPFCSGDQNVFFTLFLGELALSAWSALPGWRLRWGAAAPFGCVIVTLAAVLGAELLRTDYGGLGVLLIVLFGLLPDRGPGTRLVYAVVMLAGWWGNLIQLTAIFSVFFLIPLYSGERGRNIGRYTFYIYYPLHLLILAAAAALVRGG